MAQPVGASLTQLRVLHRRLLKDRVHVRKANLQKNQTQVFVNSPISNVHSALAHTRSTGHFTESLESFLSVNIGGIATALSEVCMWARSIRRKVSRSFLGIRPTHLRTLRKSVLEVLSSY